MQLSFTKRGWEHYIHWQENDRKLVKKINALIKECSRTPYEGSGKPEPLCYELSGWWSRRISDEHRLVYRIDDDVLIINQCRYHY